MLRMVIEGFIVLGLVAGGVVAFGMYAANRHVPSNVQEVGKVPSLTAGQSGLMQSASKVTTEVQYTSSSDNPELTVRLMIAPGWHVNANPASLKFLVPTEVEVRAENSALSFAVRYPPGEDSGIRLNGRSILVYSNGTNVRMTPHQRARALLREAGAMEITTRVQACSDRGICLAPSTLHNRLVRRATHNIASWRVVTHQ